MGFEAIKFALQAGFQDIVLEGDNLFIMNTIWFKEDGLGSGQSSCGGYYLDVSKLL